MAAAPPIPTLSASQMATLAAMGEELREDERAIFTKLTGREHEPLQRIDQFAAVVGRRGGSPKQ